MTNNPQTDYRALLKRSMAAIDDLQAKVNDLEHARDEPIAIIGAGCHFPGGADNLETFWDNLIQGVDSVTEVPTDRWDWREVYDPNPDAPGKAYTKWGGFIDRADLFDPLFFGITPREAVFMDPQQRLLLEVSWEALENAGIAADKLAGTQTGVYVGISTSDYGQRLMRSSSQELDTYFSTGTAHSVAAGRISYTLGLHGPNIAVDTACSSSLVALHLAVQGLRARNCQLALAGGVCMVLTSDGAILTSRARMMSFDGRCKTFDASADGYVRGEGCGVVVLKRLTDALADGDNVLAVIRGTAINQDGRSNGLTAPNGVAQEAVIRAALADAHVDPTTVSYVEAHGTGTSLGDPIEINALNAVYGAERAPENRLKVGSVKTNVGHLEAAAGVVGLMKVILAMQHRTLPPHLHFKTPNPLIPWTSIPIDVPTEPVAWQGTDDQPLRAALSAFGFSGTNAHIIIEEPPAAKPPADDAAQPSTVLLTQSGRTSRALRDVAARTASYLAQHDDIPLSRIAANANAGRVHFEERLGVIASSSAEAHEALTAWLNGENPVQVITSATDLVEPEVVFLFTGQGAQYAGMGRELYETQPVVRRILDKCDTILRQQLDGESILDIMFGDDDRLNQTQYTQPALFAIEYALAHLWRSWNIHPTAVMGHSVGEYVAACFAGLFSLEDGLRLIAARGRLMGSLPAGGAMAALFTDAETAAAAVAPYADQVAIAAINGPENIVISGSEGAVQAVIDSLPGIRARHLNVSHAFHSPLMEPILDAFEQVAASITFHRPQIAVIANVTGRLGAEDMSEPGYWRAHLRQPVRFAESMAALYDPAGRAFIEIGPTPTLLGMARRCVPDKTSLWLPSLQANRPTALLESLAQLYVHGAAINWEHYLSGETRLKLPTYPFQRQRYWMEVGTAQTGRSTGHPLLGNRLSSPLPIYEMRLGTGSFAYLADHRIQQSILFPASAYDEIALAAAEHYFNSRGSHSLEAMQIQVPLVVPTEGTVTVQTVLTPQDDELARVEVFSQLANGDWERHASGTLRRGEPQAPRQINLHDLKSECANPVDAGAYYAQFQAQGAEYGPTFQGIREAWTNDRTVLGRIMITAPTSQYKVHPAMLDSCFQLIGLGLRFTDDSVFIPASQGRVTIHAEGSVGAEAWGYAVLHTLAGDRLTGDILLLDDAGHVLAEINDLQFQKSRGAAPAVNSDWFYEVRWLATPHGTQVRPTGHWLIVADQTGVSTSLSALLADRGATSTLVEPDADFAAVLAAAPPIVGAIHLASIDSADCDLNGLQTAAARYTGSALRLIQALPADTRLWLVTRGAQAVHGTVSDPVQAPLWGFGAVAAAEYPNLHCVRLDLDPQENAPGALASHLLDEVSSRDGEDQIAYRTGERYAARLSRLATAAEEWTLEIPERGILDNLVILPARQQPPGPGEVQIEIVASGLNFRDVLNVMGMYPGDPGPVGNEVAGRIIALGPGVTEFNVGDAVMAMTPRAFCRTVNARVALTVRKPANLTFEEAATIPVAFLTADYALNQIARMQAGDRVLIHAAAGGVGMAAVQLARLADAEIFGTVGSAEKREVARASGVHHIMNSRTLAFADDIARITQGEGVNIVLNSLAGDFIPKSLTSLAPNGRFVEIGKTGIWDQDTASALVPGLEYTVLYLGEVCEANPQLMRAMFNRLVEQFEAGVLQPLPVQTFSINDVAEAFRFMAQARHIGKVVVSHPTSHAIRPDAAYLITGGMGGLGMATARWLVGQGARHLILVGRSAPSEQAQEAIALMAQQEAHILTAQVDIADADQVADLLNHIARELPPLRGIIHTAGVLDDGVLMQQDWSRFARVMGPKADGAWNLHTQTAARDLELDFFVLYSAAAALFGSAGQGNYAAANAFLDALAHYRRAQGLPALSINWGAWADVGMAAALEAGQRQRLVEQGMGFIQPRQGVQAFGSALRLDTPQVAIVMADWNRLLKAAGHTIPPFLTLMQGESRAETSDGDVLQVLYGAPPADQPQLALAYVQSQIARIMRLPGTFEIDGSQSLNALGIDSLMAVELRNRIRDDLNVEVAVSDLLQGLSVQQLARQVLSRLALEQPVMEAAAPADSDPESAGALLQTIDQLSDDDINTLLDRMLSEQDDQ